MELQKVEPNGETHGLINVLANSVPDNGFKRFSESFRPEMIKMKKEDSKIVEARYLNSRKGKEILQKPYMKYEGEPIQIWKFIHNHVYKLPQGLVNEVNDQMALPKRSEILDSKGVATTMDDKGEKLHEFVPVRF
jgi:hypothetical protein